MNTVENNELIALFLGFQKTEIGWYDAMGVLKLSGTKDNTFDILLFDQSLEWVMSAVNYIQNEFISENKDGFVFNIQIIGDYCLVTLKSINGIPYNIRITACICPGSKVEAIFTATVELINWYNLPVAGQRKFIQDVKV